MNNITFSYIAIYKNIHVGAGIVINGGAGSHSLGYGQPTGLLVPVPGDPLTIQPPANGLGAAAADGLSA